MIFSIRSNSLIKVYPHIDGKIYTGSFYLAMVFDPEKETFSIIEPEPRSKVNTNWRWVLDFYPKSNREVWITYQGGLITYNTQQQQIVEQLANDPVGKIHYGVNFVDGQNRIWYGTQDQGVFIFDPLRQQTVGFPFTIKKETWDYVPRRILEIDQGNKWLVSVAGSDGLQIFDRTDQNWTVIPPPANFWDRRASFDGEDVIRTSKGEILVLENQGLYKYTPGTPYPSTLSTEYRWCLIQI